MIRRSLKEKDLPLAELESKHSNPMEPLFNDSSYFLGRGGDGSYMVTRLAFRTTSEPEYWLAFHLPGKGIFKLKDPEGGEGEGFRLGKLGFLCLEPGKRWQISHSGTVYNNGKSHRAQIDLTFEGTRPLVNFKNITRPKDLAPVDPEAGVRRQLRTAGSHRARARTQFGPGKRVGDRLVHKRHESYRFDGRRRATKGRRLPW